MKFKWNGTFNNVTNNELLYCTFLKSDVKWFWLKLRNFEIETILLKGKVQMLERESLNFKIWKWMFKCSKILSWITDVYICICIQINNKKVV